MYIYELNDTMFLIKSLNTPTDNFDIRNYTSFNANMHQLDLETTLNYIIPWLYLPLIIISTSIKLLDFGTSTLHKCIYTILLKQNLTMRKTC